MRDAALNAMVMAVEGLATGRSHVFSDAVLVHAVRQFAALLPEFARDTATPDRRVDAALAAILVGEGTDTTGGGLTAAFSHTIGHHYGARNGAVDAILLPHVLDRLPPEPPAREAIADGLGCARRDLGTRLREVLAVPGAPGRLRDVGVRLEDLRGLAEEAGGDFSYRRAAGRLDTDDVVDIMRAAW
ncbi:hypothetical protein FAIPA1_540005 [Frankia sp. AiPs1]|uniref:iron-containing alcohol dehydrogenase n=1 Tax=Frankia sp. AiPa1 TaxID=573492 RepID=UPI00202B7264|nr:iron-containing alcohol dehydrogenase [Frankia sp. AiPa1]MCL9761035.1 iron-containing alcohol dehydrogenase [Frankia sp. AiPa1]